MKTVPLCSAMVFGFIFWSAVSMASSPLKLSETNLFSKVALDCKSVDVRNWSHLTRRVLQDAGVEIEEVRLCNEGHYPVYAVRFPYDPQTSQTASYFESLYAHMEQANGHAPFSFVDTADNVIVNVGVSPRRVLKITYESYAS